MLITHKAIKLLSYFSGDKMFGKVYLQGCLKGRIKKLITIFSAVKSVIVKSIRHFSVTLENLKCL